MHTTTWPCCMMFSCRKSPWLSITTQFIYRYWIKRMERRKAGLNIYRAPSTMVRRLLSICVLISVTAICAAEDKIELQTTIIKGNKELPKILYIVPGKTSNHRKKISRNSYCTACLAICSIRFCRFRHSIINLNQQRSNHHS